MIKNSTVLILGAGASIPFGFPSGIRLSNIVCKALSRNNTPQFNQIRAMGFEDGHIHKFKNSLFSSGQTSVDAFLEHRPEFIEIGKLAIAQALLPYEKEENLFGQNSETWYQYFFKKLNAPFDELNKNKVSIIIYNYDRSLDYFLFNALLNTYGKHPDEILKIVNELNLIHVYGKLGDLSWEDYENGIKYGADPIGIHIQKVADRIKIISENIKNDPELNKAHELLKNAKRIYFMGFGYNSTNLDRLNLKLLPSNLPRIIKGTTYNLSDQQMVEVKEYFINNDSKILLDPSPIDINRFIRNIDLR